jgi:hypothetical protein
MGFTFGTKKSDVIETGNYLRNFKKGETKVRFLQESPEWWGYFEHFMDGKSFPCMEASECPGCSSDNESVKRRSRRYGTFVWMVDQKRVLPFKIGAKLSERLTVRAERNNGSLLNRDYVIIRSGTGLETDYDVDQDERYEFDTASAWKNRGDQEIQEILADQFVAVFGDPDEYIKNLGRGDTAPRSQKPSGGDKSLGFADETDPSPETTNVGGTKEEAPPWETKNGDMEVSEADLKNMKRSQLVTVWKEAQFEGFNEDWDNDEIVTAIMERAS